MKIKLKYMGSSILITLSFVFGIGVISSIAMMTIKGSLEHVALISGIAQAVAPIPQELVGGMSDDMETNVIALIDY